MAQPNFAETFLQEAEELLTQVETVALELERRPDDAELVNRLFRTFHTVKGSGAMFGFEAVASFTHVVETTLDHVREGRLEVSSELISAILTAKDHIRALLQSDPPNSLELDGHGELISKTLSALYSNGEKGTALPVATAPVAASGAGEKERFQIYFRLDKSLLALGVDPACLLRELRELGECALISGMEEPPPVADLADDACLAWELTLETDRPEDAIRDVFIFVEGSGEIKIQRLEVPKESGTMLAVTPSPAPFDAAEAKPVQGAEVEPIRTPSAQHKAVVPSTVRVPSERLDQLVNLVGELVINQSRLNQAFGQSGNPEMVGTVEAMERLVAELRDSVLSIRMMPIGTTFSRFQRLVRDLSSELGREAELVTLGAETELDKTMIDQLGEPLVHLIRNSMDHGIEPPEARLAKGKPRRGTLRLTAGHEGAHVVITIEDDGSGLDKAAIRAKAEAKGLISPDTYLSDQETFNLAFSPGLTTAHALSNISGRGVGLDAVKRTIDGLRGSINLSSTPGQGTTVRLTLPLTLAIIDGLLVEIDGDRFIIPMAAVMENVELSRTERQDNNGRNLIAVRGELIPYLRLRELFDVHTNELEVEKVVIVGFHGQRLGLVVDRVLGSHQTVIQSLGRFYENIELFSGTTIMGDGRVAIIIDVAGIVRHADHTTPCRPATAA